MFTACPKCAHVPLPETQEFPAACPACGLVLAKFKALSARKDAEMALQLDRPDEVGDG